MPSDTQCPRCLISLPAVQKLGIDTKPLGHPICFGQVDGTLVGIAPATLVMELIRLEMGHHWELIRFVEALKMTESFLLGFTRLDKWGLAITWEDG